MTPEEIAVDEAAHAEQLKRTRALCRPKIVFDPENQRMRPQRIVEIGRPQVDSANTTALRREQNAEDDQVEHVDRRTENRRIVDGFRKMRDRYE